MNWHDQAFFGLHFDIHARLTDQNLGRDVTCEHLMEQLGMFVSRPGKWALVPKSVAACLCASHDLRQCIPTFRVPDRSIYLLRARNGWAADSIGCFLDTLREVLQQSYGDDFLL